MIKQFKHEHGKLPLWIILSKVLTSGLPDYNFKYLSFYMKDGLVF